MKIIKVTYTTSEQYAEQNQKNIRTVMSDLMTANLLGVNYTACICEDQKTFIHTAFFQSEEDQKVLFELPSFIHFQQSLKASGLEVPPKQEILQLVGSSNELFNA